jgi:hypothetical protein
MTIRNVLAIASLGVALAASAFAADIAGKWAAEFDTQIGAQKYTYDFKVDAGKLRVPQPGRRGPSRLRMEN